MPKSIRIDNGKPLGDPQRKSLTELAVWLFGLGVNVILNRPRRPTDNAKVERMQQTSKKWSDLDNCFDVKELQERLDHVLEIQRSKYKVRRLGRKTRLEVYPEIMHNSKTYSDDLFNAQRAYDQLAKWSFVRKVSKHGQFSLFKGIYYLGRKYRNQYISVQLDPSSVCWIVYDSHGEKIRSYPARSLTPEHIWNLTIYQKTFSNKN